jgi:DNA-binding NarL/FixJ family response regulator
VRGRATPAQVLPERKSVTAPGITTAEEQLQELPETSPQLSERELTVLRLVAQGLTARAIAQKLVLSPRTVENHVQSTLRKLRLHNRVQLTRYAIAQGIAQELEQ